MALHAEKIFLKKFENIISVTFRTDLVYVFRSLNGVLKSEILEETLEKLYLVAAKDNGN